MKISLTDAGKRFNRDWIFRHFSYSFETGNSYAITGSNGSGKSTLLQVLSGSMMLNQGTLDFFDGKKIDTESIYQQVSICAPYLEVVEEMTLNEFLEFHSGFKPYLPGVDRLSIIDRLGLQKAANKQIRYYSSGMKQRVKLAQCIFSDTAIVLLDEPCTNLDLDGISLYHQLINEYCNNRLVVVSSNDEVEYKFAQHQISMSQYKA
jgi:ABC-type multidrug transport system ATPase subunit